MNWKRTVGLDNLSNEYALRARRVYRLHFGEKDSRYLGACGPPAAIALLAAASRLASRTATRSLLRPFAQHPVNRGKLCPKGLSEHYIIEAENRAKYPLLKKNGKLVRVGWDEALAVMAERFRATQAKYGPASLGVLSTGQLVTEEFYTLGKLVQLGLGTNNYDGNHHAVHGQRRLRL